MMAALAFVCAAGGGRAVREVDVRIAQQHAGVNRRSALAPPDVLLGASGLDQIRVHAASACRSGTRRPWRRGSGPRVHARRRGICYASQGGAPEPEGAPGSQTSLAEKLILAASAVALPAVIASELHLFQTGCGLPPGPGGLYGAAEGVGFLVMFGVVAYSAYTKFKTGKGLPAGPYGLVGAAEGIWYLLLFIFLADYAYLYFTNSLPGAICYEQQ